MTIIAAVKKNDEVWMVADSLTTYGSIQRSDRLDKTKLVRFKNAYIGTAGLSLQGDILQYWVDNRHQTEGSEKGKSFKERYEWAFDSTASVHDFFQEFYLYVKDKYDLGSPKSNEVGRIENTGFLVCTPTHIYSVSSVRCVSEHQHYNATGSGYVEMLSAMDALFPVIKTPDEILKRAFDTTCKFDWGCGGPMKLINVTKTLTIKPKKNAIPKKAVKKPPRKK